MWFMLALCTQTDLGQTQVQSRTSSINVGRERTHTPLSFCSDFSRMGRVRPSSEGVLLRAKYKVVSPL